MNRIANLPSIWGIPATITTGLGLAALCVIVAFLIARGWLRSRESLLKDAIKSQDKGMVATLIGVPALELTGLDKAQVFDLAKTKLSHAFILRVFAYSALTILSVIVLILIVLPEINRPAVSVVTDPQAKLKALAFDSFSGNWTIDSDCDFAMRFRVKDGTISVQKPSPDDSVVSSFKIIGPYKNGIKADDDGIAVRLWLDRRAMIYEHGGVTQRFVRCSNAS